MPCQSKVIAFDVNRASLNSLRKAFPDSLIEVVNGASSTTLAQGWNPGTVDLFVVKARKEITETIELCRFLVSCGVTGKDTPVVTDSQEVAPKTPGPHRRHRLAARRSHSPLLVLVAPSRKSIVRDLLKAGADSCLVLPINAKDVASMLVRAQAGNQPGRHTLNLDRAQTEDRWRDEGGQG
jgi:DNA-binding NarL/FixJ family response regulator